MAFTRNHLLAATSEMFWLISDKNGHGFGWLYRTMAETQISELRDSKQSRIS